VFPPLVVTKEKNYYIGIYIYIYVKLQKVSVGQQLQVIIEVAGELNDLFDKIKAKQQSKEIGQFFHELKSGGRQGRYRTG
jgi:hypothetical protein